VCRTAADENKNNSARAHRRQSAAPSFERFAHAGKRKKPIKKLALPGIKPEAGIPAFDFQ
jgi:hypothetical protein